jgi:hypothetical protein
MYVSQHHCWAAGPLGFLVLSIYTWYQLARVSHLQLGTRAKFLSPLLSTPLSRCRLLPPARLLDGPCFRTAVPRRLILSPGAATIPGHRPTSSDTHTARLLPSPHGRRPTFSVVPTVRRAGHRSMARLRAALPSPRGSPAPHGASSLRPCPGSVSEHGARHRPSPSSEAGSRPDHALHAPPSLRTPPSSSPMTIVTPSAPSSACSRRRPLVAPPAARPPDPRDPPSTLGVCKAAALVPDLPPSRLPVSSSRLLRLHRACPSLSTVVPATAHQLPSVDHLLPICADARQRPAPLLQASPVTSVKSPLSG